VRLVIDLEGAAAVEDFLRSAGRRSRDASPAFEAIADDFADLERQRFQTRAGGRWAALVDATLARKRRAPTARAVAVLQRTQRLVRSLTVKGSPDQIRRADADGLRIGTRVPYAVYHQRGRGRRHRPPVQLTDADRRAWKSTLGRWVATGDRNVRGG